MTRYPALSPEPIIEWGPGAVKIGEHEMWQHADVALQVEGPYKTDGKTIASLTLHSLYVPWGGGEAVANVSIELTASDIVYLLRELGGIHHDEMLKDRDY